MKHYKNLFQQAKQQASQPDNDTASELARLRAENARIKKEQETITRTRDEALKREEGTRVRSEISQLLRKHNVRDNAVNDALDLVGSRFALVNGRVVPTDDNEADPEKYLGDWLSQRDHLLAPRAVPSTGASPFPASPATSNHQTVIDPKDDAALTAYLRSTGCFLNGK